MVNCVHKMVFRTTLTVIAVCLVASPAAALMPVTYKINVNSTEDVTNAADGKCSLREAVRCVNSMWCGSRDCDSMGVVCNVPANCCDADCVATMEPLVGTLPGLSGTPMGNVINIPAGVYELTIAPNVANDAATGDIDIGTHTILKGVGALNFQGNDLTVIKAGSGFIDRIIHVHPKPSIGASSYMTNVRIEGLIIDGGHADGNGGGILCESFRDGSDVFFGVQTTVFWPTIRNNHADCTLASNCQGGGFWADGPTAFDRVTLSGNVAHQGGGIFLATPFANLVVRNSTVSGNQAVAGGGGVYLDLTDTTCNYSSGSMVSNFHSSTITNNQGGGLWFKGTSSCGLIARNTIFAGNFETIGTTPMDCEIQSLGTGTPNNFFSYGMNLIGRTEDGVSTGCEFDETYFSASFDLSTSDAMLGPLTYNGGSVGMTHALLAGSPAISKGMCTAIGTNNVYWINNVDVTFDERSVPRFNGTKFCDIGAYERPITTTITVSTTWNETACGATCAVDHGIVITNGLDLNADGVVEEIQSVTCQCKSPGSLVNVVDETADGNCAMGGKKIETGIDENQDGTLGPNEVTSTSYVCNGITGLAGDDGVTGSTGPAGDDGVTGSAGPAGDDGVTGSTGPAGDDGTTGPTGPAGDPGATGSSGCTLTKGQSSIACLMLLVPFFGILLRRRRGACPLSDS